MDIAGQRAIKGLHSGKRAGANPRIKFFIGGLLIIAAIGYLIYSSSQSAAQYFLTVSELNGRGAAIVGQDVRISGAVVGSSIQYDADKLELRFTVADIPGDNNVIEQQGGLAKVLHVAVTNPKAERMQILYKGVKPDLLRDEAQAIMTGKLGADGVFVANELLLKCPTKYESAVPKQVEK